MTEAEFSDIYRAHAGKVLSGIYRIVQNESVAEELMQDSFVQFLAAAARSEIASVKGLLFQISHNLAVDYVRRDSREKRGGDVEHAASKMFDQNEMDTRALRREIIARLEKEEADFLKFYVMRADYGMSTEEIAGALGISRRSAFRLRDQLKSVLAEFL